MISDLIEMTGEELEALQVWLKENNGRIDYGEYVCVTLDTARTLAADYIRESLWAFNLELMAQHGMLRLDLSEKAIDAYRKVADSLCEDFNPIILDLIKDLNQVTDWAIGLDGHAHFLGTYDGEDTEFTHQGVDYLILRKA